MSVLIRGMEMPQGNSTVNVLIYADGAVYTGHVNDSRYSAISVPTPHGRLIDADTIDFKNDKMHDGTGHLIVADNFMNGVMWVNDCINEAPTIIDAEGSENG